MASIRSTRDDWHRPVLKRLPLSIQAHRIGRIRWPLPRRSVADGTARCQCMWVRWDDRRHQSAPDSGVRAAAVAADVADDANAVADADGADAVAAGAVGSLRPTTVDRCELLPLPWCSCWTWSMWRPLLWTCAQHCCADWQPFERSDRETNLVRIRRTSPKKWKQQRRTLLMWSTAGVAGVDYDDECRPDRR